MTDSRYFSHPILGFIQLRLNEAQTALESLSFHVDSIADAQFNSHHPLLLEFETRIQRYLLGDNLDFVDLPLAPKGTPFQLQVWQALLAIPWGETRSYGCIAQQLGRAKGSRAVGQANGKNPIPIIIPCHRVIQQNGELGGYTGGLYIKQFLLNLEQNSKGWEQLVLSLEEPTATVRSAMTLL